MRTLRLQLGLLVSASLVLNTAAHTVCAEYEVNLDAGMWIPFLPDYTAGSFVQGGVAQQTDLFVDDQTDLGTQIGMSGFYRRPGASARMVFDLELAGIGEMNSSGTFADPTPGSVWFASLDGNSFLATSAGENATFTLDSSVLYNRQYVGLADVHWLGGDSRRAVDLGFGFSHLGFDQEFTMNAQFETSGLGQYLEDLDTNYLGGEVRGSINRRHNGRDWILDFGVGFFNMNADYQGQSVLRGGGGAIFDQDIVTDEIDEFAVTVDLALRLDGEVNGMTVRPGINFKYISDMPFINHPMTEVPLSDPVFLSTESGYFLGINVEILGCCGCCCR